MAIHRWWDSDPTERYWVEVTDREDLGANLIAPTTAHSGTETPSYTLVSHVEVGDVVLHWWKQTGQEPAFVGFSRAVAGVQDSTIDWQAHGTYGRTANESTDHRPAWRIPLSDYVPFEDPITLTRLRSEEHPIRRLRDQLIATHGTPLYFPFALSDKRPLRTAQGYLFKLPKELVELLDLADALGTPIPRVRKDLVTRTPTLRPSAQRWQNDPQVRKAIERHAVDLTLEHFTNLGYLVEDVGATNPYDILAVGAEDEELHIEVKGSSGQATTVELTHGEVAETEAELSVLVVVDQINWERHDTGKITTSGGEHRIWWPWAPEYHRLTATRYRYLLP